MPRGNRRLACETKGLGQLRVGFYSLLIARIRKRRIIYFNSCRTASRNHTTSGVENFTSFLGALALKIRGQVLGSEKHAFDARRTRRNSIRVFQTKRSLNQWDDSYRFT